MLEAEGGPRWGMPDALVCFLAGFFGAQVAVLIATAFGAGVDSLAVTCAGLVGLWAGLLSSMRVVCRSKGSGSFHVDFGLGFERGRDLIGVPLGVATQLLVVPLIYVPLTHVVSNLSDKLE